MKGAPERIAAASLALAPRGNPELQGHEAAERELRRLFTAGRLPHAILLCGPRGIGKATLAYRLARFVLAGGGDAMPLAPPPNPEGEGLTIAADSGVFRRIAAGGHADLLTVERGYDPRRRRLRSEILVDDTREIAAFLRLTPAEGGWRVVVVDGADEMNRNAANALLKILEEPPARSLLLLVAHSPGRLLPTIRSRCRRLPLAPLPAPLVHRLLTTYRPELGDAEADAIARLSAGSIGRALDLAAAEGIELYRTILALLAEDDADPLALHAFADRLARGEGEEAYRAAEELLAQLLARVALAAARGGDDDGADAAVVRRLGQRVPAARWAELRDEIGQSFRRTDALNLDRKQTILGVFFAIAAAAR